MYGKHIRVGRSLAAIFFIRSSLMRTSSETVIFVGKAYLKINLLVKTPLHEFKSRQQDSLPSTERTLGFCYQQYTDRFADQSDYENPTRTYACSKAASRLHVFFFTDFINP